MEGLCPFDRLASKLVLPNPPRAQRTRKLETNHLDALKLLYVLVDVPVLLVLDLACLVDSQLLGRHSFEHDAVLEERDEQTRDGCCCSVQRVGELGAFLSLGNVGRAIVDEQPTGLVVGTV